jgi:hypothetical protein
MKEYQAEVNTYAKKCQDAADRWFSRECGGDNPPEECEEICIEFNQNADKADEWQAKVDSKFDEFQDVYTQLLLNEQLCDEKSADASVFAMAIPVRFVGVDKNFYAEFIGPEIYSYGWQWKKWYNPYVDLGITLEPWEAENNCLPVPTFYVYDHWSNRPQGSLGRFYTSPSGIPMSIDINAPIILQAEFALTHCEHYWKVGDEWFGPIPWNWRGGCTINGELGFIYEPEASIDPTEFPTVTFTIEADPLSARVGRDYTDEQTRFYAEYTTGWYAAHPKFDRDSYEVC